MLAMADPSPGQSANPPTSIATGAEVLVRSGYAALAGKRVGLVTNQTGLVGGEHLADLLATAPAVKLGAILAPEHGFRGEIEAGAKVGDAIDARTDVTVFSLYGATRKPTPAMLRGVDVLVFDIQDIGTRFYTYISTMGLAMQAAAAARIPFVVLDRPNPLGGDYVSGFVLEPALASFVGQYPIPIAHGMTVGELARAIKGERWLGGLDNLHLTVVEMRGWRRSMRWPDLQRPWVVTSPNIPTFEAALVYPGMGLVGEAMVNEGRGTPTPFSLLGAPWLDGARLADRLECAWACRRALRAGRFHAALDPRGGPEPALRGQAAGRPAHRRHGCRALRAAGGRHARAGRAVRGGPRRRHRRAHRQRGDVPRPRRHQAPLRHAREWPQRRGDHRRVAGRSCAVPEPARALSPLLNDLLSKRSTGPTPASSPRVGAAGDPLTRP